MPEARRAARRRVGRLLALALAVVLATDVVGGLVDVAAGRTTLATAWSSAATLCAPWPMMAFQVVAFLLIRRGGRFSSGAAVLLALACTVSLLSGFFDGQLGRADLGAGERAFQLWLLAATGVLGAAAAAVPLARLRARRTAGAASGAATRGARVRT